MTGTAAYTNPEYDTTIDDPDLIGEEGDEAFLTEMPGGAAAVGPNPLEDIDVDPEEFTAFRDVPLDGEAPEEARFAQLRRILQKRISNMARPAAEAVTEAATAETAATSELSATAASLDDLIAPQAIAETGGEVELTDFAATQGAITDSAAADIGGEAFSAAIGSGEFEAGAAAAQATIDAGAGAGAEATAGGLEESAGLVEAIGGGPEDPVADLASAGLVLAGAFAALGGFIGGLFHHDPPDQQPLDGKNLIKTIGHLQATVATTLDPTQKAKTQSLLDNVTQAMNSNRQVFSVKMSVGPSAGQRAIVTEMTSAQLAQAVAAVKANPDVYKGQDPRILGSMGLSSSLANGWDGKSPIAEPVFQTIMESWGRTNQTPSTQQITQAEQQVQQVESKTSTADQESYVKTQQKQIDTESDAPTKAYLQYQLDLWKYNEGLSQIKPAKVDAPLTAASRTALASYQQQLAQEQQSNQQAQLTKQSAQAKLTAAKADYSDKAQAFNQSLRTEVSNEYQQMRTYNIAYAMASGTPIDAATGYTAFNPNSLYRQNAIVNVGSPVTPIIAPMAANQPRLLATPA
jgi:hypothetical protein